MALCVRVCCCPFHQIKLSLTKMSDEFNAECKFSDRDADQCA